MTGSLQRAVEALDGRFLREHPWAAAQKIEALPPSEVARELAFLPAPVLAPVWRRLNPAAAAAVLTELPEKGAQDARLTQPDRWEPSILVDIIEAYAVVVAGLARATPTLDSGGSPHRAGRPAP